MASESRFPEYECASQLSLECTETGEQVRIVLLIILFAGVEYYFYANLMAFGSEHRYVGLLAMVGVLSIAISITSFNFVRTTRVGMSVFLVFIFITYYSLRCAVDLPGNDLWFRILGSDSGMLYYYIFGVAMSLPLRGLILRDYLVTGKRNLVGWLVVIYILFTFVNSAGLLAEALSRTRDDIFLVVEGDESYQWPGDLLSIRFLLITVILGTWLVVFWNKKSLLFMLTKATIVIVYSAQCAACIFYSQVLGSNKAVVILVGCLFSIFWLITLLVFRRLPAKTSYGSHDGYLSVSLGDVLKSFVGALTVAMVVAIVLFGLAVGGDIPLEKFRIFGFGEGSVSSIESRMALVQEGFLQQFNGAPFFGNASAELLWGAEGQYMHSILLYALTHTGVVGLLLFLMALAVSLTEAMGSGYRIGIVNCRSLENYTIIRFLDIVLFGLVFVVGVLTSSLLWAQLWFAFGFLLSPVVFGLRSAKINDGIGRKYAVL